MRLNGISKSKKQRYVVFAVLILLLTSAYTLAFGPLPAFTSLLHHSPTIIELKLTPSDGAEADYFGSAVSMSGKVALVGARYDDEKGADSGSAYVYRWDEQVWREEERLEASDGNSFDSFGHSVAISGNLALVGAPWDDDLGSRSGSAYLFRWDGTFWQEECKLLPNDGAEEDTFGAAVALSGEFALVGAPYHDHQEANSGAAYLYRLQDGNCQQEAKLTPSNGVSSAFFGSSLAIDADLLLIAASGERTAYLFRQNNISVDQNNQSHNNREGEREASGVHSWQQEANLLPSDGSTPDAFGTSVSIRNDLAIVGAYHRDEQIYSGSAYLFRLNDGSWQQEAKLAPSDEPSHNFFGNSVSIRGDMVLIGAVGDNENGTLSGAAYLYGWNGSSWQQEKKLLASDGRAQDSFGASVSMGDDMAIVGALGDDDHGSWSGAAYLYLLSTVTPTLTAIPTNTTTPVPTSTPMPTTTHTPSTSNTPTPTLSSTRSPTATATITLMPADEVIYLPILLR